MIDHGPLDYEPLDDYPAFCIRAAQAVVRDQEAGIETLGVVFGGSGNGEQIAANKVAASARPSPGASRPPSSRASTTTRTSSRSARASTPSTRRRPSSTASSRRRSRARSATPAASPSSPPTRTTARSSPTPARPPGSPDVLAATTARSTPRPADPARRPLRPPHRPPVRPQLRRPLRLGAAVPRAASPRARPSSTGATRDGARRRQADVPGVRRRPVAARAPGDVRRVGLRGRDHRRRHHRIGERPDGSDQPARHRARRRRADPRRRGRELAHLDRRPAPRARPRAHVGADHRSRRRRRRLAAAGRRPGAAAPAHRVTCADLRGPTACELQTPDEVAATIAKLGPDPLVDDVAEGEERFAAIVRRKPTPIGLLLMDQAVVSGIGNVYRAELLFRARQNPHTPGRDVPDELVRDLWRDWVRLLAIGVETGQMMTMDDLDPEAYREAMASRTTGTGSTTAPASRAGSAGRRSWSRRSPPASCTGARPARLRRELSRLEPCVRTRASR